MENARDDEKGCVDLAMEVADLRAELSQCLAKLAAVDELVGQLLTNDQTGLSYFKHAMHRWMGRITG